MYNIHIKGKFGKYLNSVSVLKMLKCLFYFCRRIHWLSCTLILLGCGTRERTKLTSKDVCTLGVKNNAGETGHFPQFLTPSVNFLPLIHVTKQKYLFGNIFVKRDKFKQEKRIFVQTFHYDRWTFFRKGFKLLSWKKNRIENSFTSIFTLLITKYKNNWL